MNNLLPELHSYICNFLEFWDVLNFCYVNKTSANVLVPLLKKRKSELAKRIVCYSQKDGVVSVSNIRGTVFEKVMTFKVEVLFYSPCIWTNKIYITGGVNDQALNMALTIIDPVNKRVDYGVTQPDLMVSHKAVASDGYIYCVFGSRADIFVVRKYDIEKNEWSKIQLKYEDIKPCKTIDHVTDPGAVIIGNKIYVAGGYKNGNIGTEKCYVIDLDKKTLSPFPDLRYPKIRVTLISKSGYIYAIGRTYLPPAIGIVGSSYSSIVIERIDMQNIYKGWEIVYTHADFVVASRAILILNEIQFTIARHLNDEFVTKIYYNIVTGKSRIDVTEKSTTGEGSNAFYGMFAY